MVERRERRRLSSSRLAIVGEQSRVSQFDCRLIPQPSKCPILLCVLCKFFVFVEHIISKVAEMFFGNECAQAVVRKIAMARDLIDHKLAERQRIVHEAFHNVAAAYAIERNPFNKLRRIAG